MADTHLHTPGATPTDTPPSSTPPRRARRWWHWLLVALAGLLLLIVLVLGGGWWWAGQADSLGYTLSRVARWLPADQELEAREVQGTLRNGGKIGWLRWSSPTMQVVIENTEIGWHLQPLLSRELKLGQVHIQTLRIRSTPDPAATEPTQPLESVVLPLRVDIPFQVDTLAWEGPPEVQATDLQGHYRFNGSHHQLAVNSLRWAEGTYAAQLKLQGAAPMEIEARLKGSIQTVLPQQQAMRLQTLATAHITGHLSGADAALGVQANAYAKDVVLDSNRADISEPSKAESDNIASSQTLRAQISATLHPWQSQPVAKAQAQLHQVDVSLFWPQGPHTLLSGEVQAGPSGQGWQLRADVRNAIPGPWDLHTLPLHQLQADVQQNGSSWVVTEAQLNLGTGHITAQGSFDSASQAVQGQAVLHQVNPAALWSTLDPSPLKGTLKAHTRTTADASPEVDFDIDITSTQGPATGRVARTAHTASSLRIDGVQAQGHWQQPLLTFTRLEVQALQAHLHSKKTLIDTDSLLIRTDLQAQAPGATLNLQGTAGATQGDATARLQLTSAAQFQAWAQRLPGMESSLRNMALDGSAKAELRWQGGWAKLLQRLQQAQRPIEASGLKLHAAVQTQGFQIRTGDAQTRIQQLDVQAQGSPEQLQLSVQGQLLHGPQKVALNTQASVGLLQTRNADALDWHAKIDQLQGQWSADGSERAWKVRLDAPVAIRQLTSGSTVRDRRMDADAGKLTVQAPGNNAQATVQWGPAQLLWTAQGDMQVRSQGQLHNIPLAWADALGPSPEQGPLTQAGISGDLSLQGRWNIDTQARTPVIDVVLERAAGDIRLAMVEEPAADNVTIIRSAGTVARRADGGVQTPRVPGRGLRARLQDLRLQVQTKGQEVHAGLLWNSERAGQLSANLRSSLTRTNEGWQWPESAPIAGQIRANLPDIGIWAMFAPPGWRVSGSLQANMQLAGTRQDPRWQGSLNADGLSIVSLLDGLDLQNGRMRAHLEGTRLQITELSLQGGKGSTARILGYSGNLTAAPQDGGSLQGSGYVAWNPHSPAGSSGMQMDLQLQANKLQVLVRADRQLSASGKLQASLNQGQIVLRGDLTVDRAAILLPDDSAPSLDKDVVVHSAASRKAEAERAQAAAAANTAGASPTTAKAPDILVNLDLGQDFALQGFGITTRLRGQLQVRAGATAGAPPRITGEIRTEQGRYRAWGQSLDVESGLIRFNGPYNNPSLDITAIRPNITVRAGVRVTGSATAPRVTLFSDPAMSDAEKLSWIVMGRDTASGGAEAALLQQAALALLSGGGTGENLAGRFGLDEIGFKGANTDSSDSDAAGAALTVGKRLSKDLYVTYEQSLNGAMGTLYIFYDLSRRLTLRAQTGLQTAVDLIYTVRKD